MTSKQIEVLRKMCRGLGIRQAWLAKQASVHPSKISQWMTNKVKLSEKDLLRVSDAISVVVIKRANAHTLPGSRDPGKRAEAISTTRRVYGITQVELGRKAGLSGDTISLFENGYIRLNPAEVERLEKALNSLIGKRRKKMSSLKSLLGASGSLSKKTILADTAFQAEVAHEAGRELGKDMAKLQEKLEIAKKIIKLQDKIIRSYEERPAKVEDRESELNALKKEWVN